MANRAFLQRVLFGLLEALAVFIAVMIVVVLSPVILLAAVMALVDMARRIKLPRAVLHG